LQDFSDQHFSTLRPSAVACQPAASLCSAASQHFSQVVWEPAHKRRTYHRKQRFLMRC